jgi:hypothetical protein
MGRAGAIMAQISPNCRVEPHFCPLQVDGNAVAITACEAFGLSFNPFECAILGHLYHTVDRNAARNHFLLAFSLAKTQADRHIIAQRLADLEHIPSH